MFFLWVNFRVDSQFEYVRSEVGRKLLWNCSETALKLLWKKVRGKGVSAEAQTRTSQTESSVLVTSLIYGRIDRDFEFLKKYLNNIILLKVLIRIKINKFFE